jgi:hypothetical protein
MHVTRLKMRCLAAMGLIAPAMAGCSRADASTDVQTGASRHMPSCPSGNFCVQQPASVAADAGAPAPYGMCSATATAPLDAGVPTYAFVSFDAEGTKNARVARPRSCCYTWTQPCGGGRAYRDEAGNARTAEASNRDDWCDEGARAAGAGEDSARWVREGMFEHGSIASFARLMLDLLAVGAPMHLVEAAGRAALDEVKHARIAFGLASAGRRAVGPGPLRTEARHTPTLESIVREAVADGCIGETAAALALREEAGAHDARVGALLDEMAEDEERHAELAYATVAWALSVDPSLSRVVGDELARARRTGVHARVVEQIAAPCLRQLTS